MWLPPLFDGNFVTGCPFTYLLLRLKMFYPILPYMAGDIMATMSVHSNVVAYKNGHLNNISKRESASQVIEGARCISMMPFRKVAGRCRNYVLSRFLVLFW